MLAARSMLTPRSLFPLPSFSPQQLTEVPYVESRSAAELALDHEYAKDYSRRCMASHLAKRRAQIAFLRARWTAINALPVPLRNEALKEDMTPWPREWMPIPWTPREYVKRFGASLKAQEK